MNKSSFRYTYTWATYWWTARGRKSTSSHFPHLRERGREGTCTAGHMLSPTCGLAVFWLFAVIDLSISMWALSHWDVTSPRKGGWSAEVMGRIKQNRRVLKLKEPSEIIYDLGFKQTCGCQEGGGESRMDREFGVGRCKLLHLEWVSNGVLLYSTGNYIHSLGIEYDGR